MSKTRDLRRAGRQTLVLLACYVVAGILWVSPVTAEIGSNTPMGGQWTAHELASRIASRSFVGGFLGDVEISPTGQWVIYSVCTRSTVTNSVTTTYFVREIAKGREIQLPAGASHPRWSPDERSIAFVYGSDSRSGSFAILPFRDGKLGREVLLRALATGSDPATWQYKWSPDASKIALLVPKAKNGTSAWTASHPALDDQQWVYASAPRFKMILVQLKALTVEILPVPDFISGSPRSFDWSPTGTQLVLSVNRDPSAQGLNSQLEIFDIGTGKSRIVADLPGRNWEPLWSPDGQQILFASDDGHPEYFVEAPPAILDLQHNTVRYLSNLPRGEPLHWSRDGRSFLWVSPSNFSLEVLAVNSSTETTTDVSPAGSADLHFDENQSVSANGSMMAFSRASPSEPAELFVVRADDGRQTSAPTKITSVGADLPISGLVSVSSLSWQSRDGHTIIHGILIRPKGAIGPLPTLIYNVGGPGMVRADFGDAGVDMPIVCAALGFTVLIPNTRGRVGFGEVFAHAIQSEHSYVEKPFEDLMDGLSDLVRLGFTDPARVAIAGHSYGGYLTEYALTQTSEFKGAVVHEGHLTDLSAYMYAPYYTDRYQQILSRDLYGATDPLSPHEQQRLFDESPGFHADKVKTPVLLLYGANSLARDVGERLYFQYLHFGVPTELFVYDEAHVFTKPVDEVDATVRAVGWIDQWTRH